MKTESEVMEKNTCIDCSFRVFCAHDKSIVYKKKHLRKNQFLHIAGDKFKHLYAVQSGALKTYEIDPLGNEVIHGIFLQNEIYGYEAIHTQHYIFSTRALCDTVLCEISYASFLTLLHQKPHLLSRILSLLSQQLTFQAYLKLITARQRLAAFLVDIQSRLMIDTEIFLLPMTYQDIGYYLGLATETVSRILSEFKKNKMIAVDKKMVTVFNLDKLKLIATGHN